MLGLDFRDGILFVPEVLKAAEKHQPYLGHVWPANHHNAVYEGCSHTMKEQGIRDDYIAVKTAKYLVNKKRAA